MIAILVTGSREWTDYGEVSSRLAQYEDHDPRILIHGDADGADQHADTYASAHGWQVIPMPYIKGLGKLGGPARNRHMVEVAEALRTVGYEVHCEAFPMPDSRGTWDCVRKAKAAGIPVTVTRGGGE